MLGSYCRKPGSQPLLPLIPPPYEGHREGRGEQGPVCASVGKLVSLSASLEGSLVRPLVPLVPLGKNLEELQESLAQTRTMCQAGVRPKPVWTGGLVGISGLRLSACMLMRVMKHEHVGM